MANRMILNETSYHGKGAIENVPVEFKARGFKKAAVITDKDLIKFEVATKVTTLLDAAGIDYVVYDGIVPNPTIENVQEGVEFVKNAGADAIIAIGGGSPIDTAKAIGIIITNPEFADVVSLEGVAETKNRKFVCVDPHDIPVVAFIDSDMMMGMPKALCAATGMDAMTHAIEGYITKGAWEMTDMLHIKAIEIIGRSLPSSVAGDAKGREDMALAQYIAGMGFSNVGLGLVHGMAHPLSAWYNIPHGVACATLLPTVMKFNKDFTGEKYRDIAKVLGVANADTMDLAEVRDAACAAIDALSKEVGIPATISELGVKEADLAQIAEDAFRDVCTPGNPRDASVAEIIAIYKSLM